MVLPSNITASAALRNTPAIDCKSVGLPAPLAPMTGMVPCAAYSQNMQWRHNDKLDGQAQFDETCVGGKEKNKFAEKKLNAGRGAVRKTAVVGIRDQHG